MNLYSYKEINTPERRIMENINIQVRPAKLADIPAISDVLHVAFSDYYNVLGIKIKTANETYDEIKNDILTKQVYVATANMFNITGTIRFEAIDNVCYISRFGVLPKWQSTGSGGQLLKYAEQYCKENNLSAMALHTATKLSKQVQYYYKQGFFVHSTTDTKGYIRGLLVKEILPDYSLAGIID
ncbi:MAG: GNAT family N-acetyltransferase [Clostridia bacterium]|nr:GNAT family N-acetyltransferase [Clostridia bacterium]